MVQSDTVRGFFAVRPSLSVPSESLLVPRPSVPRPYGRGRVIPDRPGGPSPAENPGGLALQGFLTPVRGPSPAHILSLFRLPPARLHAESVRFLLARRLRCLKNYPFLLS